ncbi:MAG: protein phosphatase 2C domain-containing protein [Verrucomicrobia bacterium]|jgi:hypothetical protein|nr:protein phosphatase 2C domain-containing protein [Verrucomicrobiota bacterium]
MWAAVSASVIGTSHEATGAPCQDACHVLRLRIGDEEVLLAAIADGAGSASHSQIGSSEAVQHLLKLVAQPALILANINQDEFRGWYEAVLEHLKSVAGREGTSVSELACTLLLAVVWKGGAVFGQIGDGAWVLEKDGALVAGTWPETGEYANVTVFLTTQGALDHLQFQRIEGKISGVAGFTDGIQSIVLNYGNKTPHAPFFNAVLSPLRNSADETELTVPLQQMLASEVITSRTDDDKTLVLAVWREPGAEGKPGAEVKPAEVNSDGTAE